MPTVLSENLREHLKDKEPVESDYILKLKQVKWVLYKFQSGAFI